MRLKTQRELGGGLRLEIRERAGVDQGYQAAVVSSETSRQVKTTKALSYAEIIQKAVKLAKSCGRTVSAVQLASGGATADQFVKPSAPLIEGTVRQVLEGEASWCILQGDSFELLASELADGSIDAVITDPPYSSGGMFRGDRTASTTDKYVANYVKSRAVRQGYEGDNRDQHSFLVWLSLWTSRCLTISKPGGAILLFSDWRQLPTVTDAIQCGGWIWRGIVPWDKSEGTRPKLGSFRSQAEYVVVGSAGVQADNDAAGALPGYFHGVRLDDDKVHEAGKPTAIMCELVEACVLGGVVLDPFSGYGSTGVGALRRGRRYIGFERSEHWSGLSRDRLRLECQKLEAVGLTS
jgi:site-specific DNA-methyltransferase (adenine-specific)